MRVMALFSTSFFFQNACVWVRMTPGRGHLCHTDTFLVFFRLCFQIIDSEINCIAKSGSDLCNFYSNLEFWILFRKQVLLFFTGFKFLMFQTYCENFRTLNKGSLLKTCLKFTHPTKSAYFAAFLLWEK